LQLQRQQQKTRRGPSLWCAQPDLLLLLPHLLLLRLLLLVLLELWSWEQRRYSSWISFRAVFVHRRGLRALGQVLLCL
jgi:hypothetical protein